MWILGLKGLKPGMLDLLLYKYNEKSCFFFFLLFFFFYQVVGCCGTYTVDSRMDTCIRQIRKTVGNMKVLVSTFCHKLYSRVCTVILLRVLSFCLRFL